MKPLFLIVLVLISPGLLRAKEFALPAAKPVVNIQVPDTWRPEAIERGVQAKSRDGSVSLSVECTGSPLEMATIIDETDALLKSHKVSLDRSHGKDRKYLLNGLPAEELLYTGTDEEGPTVVSFTFVTIKDRAIVLTCWAATEGFTKHRPELDKILQSLRTVGH